ncbi:MAG: tripartite tricarboxylate transporter permease [Rhodobacteraceae bacterium]|nr:tripartite tricarboxylate transporter permease [Paracoccaceae bacterium]
MDFSSLLDLWTLGTAAASIGLGLFVGLLFGALPGLGLTIAITLLLPLTYAMSPINAILMLLAVYQAAEYAGSISAITLGIPGTVMAAPILQDGRAMAKASSPGKALAFSLYSSVFGGVFGAVVLVLFAQPLARFALTLGDAEFFLLGLLGLVAVTTFEAADPLKAAISIVLGLLTGLMGLDIISGMPRMTFNVPQLFEGPSLIALVVGLFAFAELFFMMGGNMRARHQVPAEHLRLSLTWAEMRTNFKAAFAGSTIGALIGILPGVGSTVSGWLAYSAARKLSKEPQKFGKGASEGIVGPDAANNATVGGALLPFLTLGIPGSAAIAIISGAFIIHGIQPGPLLARNNPGLLYAIFAGFFVTTIGLFFMAKLLNTGFVRILVTPNAVLVPLVLMLSILGVYTYRSEFFDLWLALGISLAAVAFRKLDYSIVGFVMAVVLAPIIETSFRRALVIANGDMMVFLHRPASAAIIALMIGMMIYAVVKSVRPRARAAAANEPS